MSEHLRVSLGTSQLDIFPLNLGGNTFGWTADEQTSFDILDGFAERGGNFIDTADMYSAWVDGLSGGESETMIGKWLASRPADVTDDIVVATKVGKLPPNDSVSPEHILAGAEASLRRLGVDAIDLYYLHYDDEATPIPEQVQAMATLVEQGKIRYVGLSNYSPARMREFFVAARGTAAMPVAIQPQYNLLHRHDFEANYQPIAREFRAAVFPYFSLASGMLTGRYRTREDIAGRPRENFLAGAFSDDALHVVDRLVGIAERHDVEPATVALAWLLAKGVTAPIASVSRPSQLDALMAAPAVQLTSSEVTSLDAGSQVFA